MTKWLARSWIIALLAGLSCGGPQQQVAGRATPSPNGTDSGAAGASTDRAPATAQPFAGVNAHALNDGEPRSTPVPEAGRRPTATWPTEAQFEATRASLPLPWTLASIRVANTPLVVVARRQDDGWLLGGVVGGNPQSEPCEKLPCPWPTSFGSSASLREPAPLPSGVAEHLVYARTLLDFEGPLNLHAENTQQVPEGLWAEGDPHERDLRPLLEPLRRYHPMGMCSMDTAPQQVSLLRAIAAAQAGHTGWAVQGWIDSVGYFSTARMVWSSYGQQHPNDHLRLLQEVGVDPERLLLGLLLEVPGHRRTLHLADIRRVLPDLGETFTRRVRELAESDRVDPFNRALLVTALIADTPEADPSYAALPPEAQELVAIWFR